MEMAISTPTNLTGMRELTDLEIDEVNGGVAAIILLVAAAIGAVVGAIASGKFKVKNINVHVEYKGPKECEGGFKIELEPR